MDKGGRGVPRPHTGLHWCRNSWQIYSWTILFMSKEYLDYTFQCTVTFYCRLAFHGKVKSMLALTKKVKFPATLSPRPLPRIYPKTPRHFCPLDSLWNPTGSYEFLEMPVTAG